VQEWLICYDNTCSNSDFWHFDLWSSDIFLNFFNSIQALSFDCLKLGASFSVWRYIFRIVRSLSSFKVVGLISRSWSQISSSTRICAALGCSLISICFDWMIDLLIRRSVCQLAQPLGTPREAKVQAIQVVSRKSLPRIEVSVCCDSIESNVYSFAVFGKLIIFCVITYSGQHLKSHLFKIHLCNIYFLCEAILRQLVFMPLYKFSALFICLFIVKWYTKYMTDIQ